MLGQRLVKLAVADRAYAESVLSAPSTGILPESSGEIALDEFTMDSLGIPRELGSSVTLLWIVPDGSTYTSDFTLCGWWASPTVFTEACAWISADTARELVPGYQEEACHNVTLGVNLYQPEDLDRQAVSILEEQGDAAPMDVPPLQAWHCALSMGLQSVERFGVSLCAAV